MVCVSNRHVHATDRDKADQYSYRNKARSSSHSEGNLRIVWEQLAFYYLQLFSELILPITSRNFKQPVRQEQESVKKVESFVKLLSLFGPVLIVV